MYKYIIFDFDGTLADSKETAVTAYNRLAERRGYRHLTEADIPIMQKQNIAERCKYVGVKMFMIPFLAGEFYNDYRASMKEMELYQGTREMLLKIHDMGIKMAIISSNHSQIIQNFLDKEQVNCIDDIICSKFIFAKHRMLKRFMKEHNLEKEDLIYVGDECRDINSCKKIGLKVIWVSWGFDLFQAAAASDPDYMVEEKQEILDILQKS